MAMIRRLVQNPQSGSFRLIVAVNWGWEQSRKQENEAIGWLNQLRSCVIELPDLAERVDEIGALARYHVKRICRERGLEEKVMTPEFYRALETYSWPGNVRELVNSLEQVVLLAGSKKSLFVKDLPNHIRIEAIKSSAKTKIGL
jgi:two-component system NtrC family response regulator